MNDKDQIKWSPEQKEGIEESIRLWRTISERIRNGEEIPTSKLDSFKREVGASIGLNPEMKYSCPLCERFLDDDDGCSECPIEIDITPLYPLGSIGVSCYYTPYADFETAYSNYQYTIDEKKRERYRKQMLESSDAFVEYLKHLLKKGLK